MARRCSRRLALAAAIVYAVCDVVIWRPGVSFGVGAGVIGSSRSSDYQVMTWALEWWPWAVLHGIDPLHTGLVWAPSGYSTTWMTSIPVLSMVAAPLTLAAGPLVSYNLLMLAAPVAAALSCYCLCRELCERYWPALLGGFLFGFSPYMLGQAVAQHLNLVMVWPLPLLALIAVRYHRGRISSRRACLASAGLGLVLLGCSVEVFATAVALGGIVLLVSLAFARELRRTLVALAGLLAVALTVDLVISAPMIWSLLEQRRPPLPYAPEQYATDFANIVVPTRITLGGTTAFARNVSRGFVGNLGEQDGYLGAPLIGVCLLAAWHDRRQRAWIALAATVIALVLSLGPALVVAGHTVGDIPVALDRLPVLGLALPSRLAVFVLLPAICLAMRWLGHAEHPRLRLALGIMIAVSFAPYLGALVNTRAEANADRTRLPTFAWEMPHAASGFVPFADRLAPRTAVLALPLGGLAPASFWQAETDMRFRLVGGYTPFAPAGMATDPLIAGLLRNVPPPLVAYRLRAYLFRTGTRVVVVQAYARRWIAIVRTALHTRSRRVAGMVVFRIDDATLRDLLRRPRSQRNTVGFPLSRSATPADSLVASGDTHISIAGWLTFDWHTRHVVVQASTRRGPWKRAVTLSNPRVEASGLHVAVGGDRAIATWIEADPAGSMLRAAEFLQGRWRRIALAPSAPVTVEDAVAVAPNGVATLAWTAQNGPRTLLRAVRIGANGRVSAPATLSNVNHSVAGFSLAAASDQTTLVWRERDATALELFAARSAPLDAGWSSPQRLPGGHAPSSPIVRTGHSGTVVIWTDNAPRRAALKAYRLSSHTGRAGAITVARSRPQVISTPSVLAMRRGTLLAWCARTNSGSALRVAFVTARGIIHRNGLARCAETPPHLLAVGARAILNAGSRSDLYLVTPELRCRRLPSLRSGNMYAILGSPTRLTIITGSGGATGRIDVHQTGSLRFAPTPQCTTRRPVLQPAAGSGGSAANVDPGPG